MKMTNKMNLVTVIAAGMLVASAAARAQYATIPDPNLAPTAVDEEAGLVTTPADGVQLAAIPDPNLDPSTTGTEVALLPTSPDGPQLAVAPNPNLDEPAAEEVHEMHATRNSDDASGPVHDIN
jgi:hypothetical protein